MHDFGPMLSWLKTTIQNQWCNKMLGTNSQLAAQAVAAVQKRPELVRALDDSVAAKVKQKNLHAEMAALKRKREKPLTAPDAAAIETRLTSINGELRHLEKKRLTAIRNIQRDQPIYAEAVCTALSQHRREAAARVLAAITELQKAAIELDEIAKAIEVAGGRPRRLPLIPYIDGIAAIAREIEAAK